MVFPMVLSANECAKCFVRSRRLLHPRRTPFYAELARSSAPDDIDVPVLRLAVVRALVVLVSASYSRESLVEWYYGENPLLLGRRPAQVPPSAGRRLPGKSA